jgi:hypothetical protein
LASFEQGKLMEAQTEFERAASLDDDYPGVFVGYALVYMAQGEFWSAHQQIEKALHEDGDFADAYIAQGRLLAAEGSQRGFDSEDWLKEALRAFDTAIDLQPADGRAYFHRGMAYLAARDLMAAEKSFLQVQKLKRGPLMASALGQIERIQQIRRAAPGSEWGIQLGLVEKITRAELTVLLLEELKLAELVRQRRPAGDPQPFQPPGDEQIDSSRDPDDIDFSWARLWIEEILALGVPGLELAGSSFRPDEPITRANYARVNEGILVLITGDRRLSTQYIGETSPFPDVRSDSYAYNAIALNVDRGIMSADKLTGRFSPDETISGAEALLIVRELQNAVRMEF